jgi:hypothetical protein
MRAVGRINHRIDRACPIGIPPWRSGAASPLAIRSLMTLLCLLCGPALRAQELAPVISESRFRQIHHQVFHADEQPVSFFQPSCVQPPPSVGCADLPAMDMPSYDDTMAPTFSEGLLPGSFGATRGSLAAAPNMIGDFFGGGIYFQGDLVSNAGGDRPFKLSDNWQPLPTDRLYFNYHHFNAVTTGVNNAFVGTSHAAFDRYTMGIEKSFFDGLLSLDFRAPYASALDATQVQNFTAGPLQNTEFGNVGLATKLLLFSRERFALSGGAGMTFPTGDDYRLFDMSGVEIASLQNESVHWQPFLGFVATPGGRLFLQGVMQLDIDVNGNPATINGVGAGRIQSQTLLYSDVSMGYWVYENPNALILSGIAPLVELHYTTAVQDTDALFGEFTNVFNRQDYLNLTGGLAFAIGQQSYLTFATAMPLRSFPDRGFDAETGIQYVRRY